ncbi:hypothetical protein F4779DRAFT_618109 [Xylariaceae sp. FL0662B]|nr:hypothetical protein F4779DRAFT_618109 [Xylariaceae sp. FL0662B]
MQHIPILASLLALMLSIASANASPMQLDEGEPLERRWEKMTKAEARWIVCLRNKQYMLMAYDDDSQGAKKAKQMCAQEWGKGWVAPDAQYIQQHEGKLEFPSRDDYKDAQAALREL